MFHQVISFEGFSQQPGKRSSASLGFFVVYSIVKEQTQ
jgi:hypothetical protein